MPYIIDGHNLIPRVPGLSLKQIDDENRLILILQEFARTSGKQVDVYFDKAPPGSQRKRKFGRVTAFFVPDNTIADTAIKRRLRNLGKAAKNWTVVSADHDILLTARSLQAKTIDPGEFARDYLSSPEVGEQSIGTDPDISLSDDEIAGWLDAFSNK